MQDGREEWSGKDLPCASRLQEPNWPSCSKGTSGGASRQAARGREYNMRRAPMGALHATFTRTALLAY